MLANHTLETELRTTRGRVFFWLGVAVLPVFWVVWMRRRFFSHGQMLGAWVWTLIYLLGVMVCWRLLPEFRERVYAIPWTYAYTAFHVGVALWIWLLFRVGGVKKALMGLLMSVDCVAIMLSLMPPMMRMIPVHPLFLMFIGVPAVAHLLVEPMRRFQVRQVKGLPKIEAERPV